jgi:hypothetical protein
MGMLLYRKTSDWAQDARRDKNSESGSEDGFEDENPRKRQRRGQALAEETSDGAKVLQDVIMSEDNDGVSQPDRTLSLPSTPMRLAVTSGPHNSHLDSQQTGQDAISSIVKKGPPGTGRFPTTASSQALEAARRSGEGLTALVPSKGTSISSTADTSNPAGKQKQAYNQYLKAVPAYGYTYKIEQDIRFPLVEIVVFLTHLYKNKTIAERFLNDGLTQAVHIEILKAHRECYITNKDPRNSIVTLGTSRMTISKNNPRIANRRKKVKRSSSSNVPKTTASWRSAKWRSSGFRI